MTQGKKTAKETLISLGRPGLGLDFANSRYWRGTDQPTETLETLDDVFRWLSAAKAFDPEALEALRARWPPVNKDHAATIQLREALYRAFAAAASRDDPMAGDLELLNRTMAAAPARTRLVPREGAYFWSAALEPRLPDLLAPVLWSAADVLAEPRRDRIRLCANDKCVWLFLDDSKSGTRRWCDMKACGNRAKAHRHYERKKQAAAKRRP